ncbi:MAG: C25 family cysteine peptidase, partial [Dissulfuribacterales bacterium]
FVGLWLFSGGFVHQSPYAADTLVETPFVADPILDNPVVIPPTNFDFVRPYVPPVALDLEFFSPTPPGGILEPPAPALQDYTFLPWSPLPIGPVAGIPEISGIYEFLVPFDLLVIAHEDFLDELVPLKTHKDYTDVPTRIYSWQDLVDRFADQGRDDPERIKKAIAAFRQGCNIKYVMLVGDVDRFPVRYCMIYDPTHWGDGYAPADLYYADLYDSSGTTFDDWDGDGDGIFCEMLAGSWTPGSTLASINLDGMDLYPDVAVGRIPASTEAEVTTYVNKVISYEFKAYKASWFDEALLVVPGYRADDGKYYEYPGSWSAKENVATNLSAAGIASTKLYDSRIEGLTPGLGDAEPTAGNISTEIDAGVGFVNFSGHGNTTTWGPYTSTDVAGLGNAERLPVVFAGACSTAQFHFGDTFLAEDGTTFTRSVQCPQYNGANRCWPVNPSAARSPEPATVQPSVRDVDSMAESFLVKRDTGGIGYIGSYTGAQGGSQVLDRYLFEGYRYMLKPTPLGYLWNYAVRRYIDNNFHIDFNMASNWVPQAMFHHIQKYMLFGDPSLRVGGVAGTQRADFAKTFEMAHDGWRGSLCLSKASGDFIEQTPNMGGKYTSSDGAEHSVRGYVRTATYYIPPAWGPDHKISFYIDFNDTLSQNDDQKFDGYLFSWEKDTMAGLAWWNDIPYGFFARKNGIFVGGPNLLPGTVSMDDFLGIYRMDHDGWKGTLELWQPTLSLVGTGNVAGRYTAGGVVHNVRGQVKTAESVLPADWPQHKIEFFIDFAGTSDLNDDQKFEGYLFTQTKDAMAGLTWWNTVPLGFYAEKGRPPSPCILADSEEDTSTVAPGAAVSVSVQLDPGILMEDVCDWWVAASTPFGLWSFVVPGGWQPGLHACLQAAPIPIPTPIEVWNYPLPPGFYTFYFALDSQANGTLDGVIWWDSVTILVQ